MVILRRNKDGRPTVFCDPCIADLVSALNAGGVPTKASCCGHGERNGTIFLADGRQLEIHGSLNDYRQSIGLEPINPAPAERKEHE